MKAHNRARLAFIKWTAIIFVPVLVLLVVMLITRNFEKTYSIAERCCYKINCMFEHRAYKVRVARRGYELILEI